MYKSVCVLVVLLAAFAFTSGSRSADASPTTPVSPPIVARAKLVNQTATIPSTTIFAPTQDGLYRLSVYAIVTKTDTNSGSFWSYGPAFTDDSGPHSLGELLTGYGNSLGTFTYEAQYGAGIAMPFEAKAGSPITYSVTQVGPPDNSAYSLYYTLERLE